MRKCLCLVCLLLLVGTAWAVGEKAADFTLKDLNGKSYRLADYRGKVVVLSFWMTWCTPCKMEMPQLKVLYEKYHAQGLELWSITADNSSDIVRVKAIVNRYQLTNPVLHDADSRVNGLFNPRGDYPLTVLIDKEGKVAWVKNGYSPGEEKELEDQILRALGQAPAESK